MDWIMEDAELGRCWDKGEMENVCRQLQPNSSWTEPTTIMDWSDSTLSAL